MISLGRRLITGLCWMSLLWLPNSSWSDDPYAVAREKLVRDRIATAGVRDARVLDAIRNTPRHEFVRSELRDRAYLDMALPIGSSQTISSPFIVAMMTEALDPQPTDRVLEIGTGSGYQAAVLSPLVDEVYSIEIVKELGEQAAKVLQSLEYENVHTRIGDGFEGWEEAAPFDKIIVTCSPESVPQPLVDQLKEGGTMIIPVGERYQQTLYRMVKKDGQLQQQKLQPTLFVPMTGTAEASRKLLPDTANPTVINGGFEMKPDADESAPDFVPGWYYGRQAKCVTASESEKNQFPRRESERFVRFSNETPGLGAHLLQGLAIDGSKIASIRLSGWNRTEKVKPGPEPESLPAIAISFYNDKREDLGTFSIGPFQGSRPWRSASRLIRVPAQTREAIVRIGLFGATGTADFDDIQVEKVTAR
jgi:protein-L-isoaspartate(D-aspartate) O-methyltransferase